MWIKLKSEAALKESQKDTKYLGEEKDQHRVNLNDLINRKKLEEKDIRKVNIINYSLAIILVLLVVLIYHYIKW